MTDDQIHHLMTQSGCGGTLTPAVRRFALACRAAIYSAEQAQIEAPLRTEIERLSTEAAFYKRRVQALERWQSRMRDPERTVVCDILANGFTLDPPVPSDRYEVKRGEETLDEAGAAAAALYNRWTGKA